MGSMSYPLPVFLGIALALTAAVAWYLIRPLLRRAPSVTGDARSTSPPAHSANAAGQAVRAPGSAEDANRLAVLRTRRQEIEAEQASGRLTRDEADAAIERLAVDLGGALSVNQTERPWRRRPALATLLALGLALGAFGLYGLLGSARLLTPDAQVAAGEPTAEQIAKAMADLKAQTQSNPADLDAWVMLAQGHRALGQLTEAAAAYKRAVALAPDGKPLTARLYAEYAEILLNQRNGEFKGEPMALLEQALKHNPDDQKALGLLGAGLYRLGQPAEGIRLLRRLLAQLPPDSEQNRQIAAVIARIESESAAAATATPPAGKAPVATSIQGRVFIAPALIERLPANATVFIVARGIDGQRMPVAVARQPFKQAPFEFVLTDEQSMTANRKLSSLDEVVIEARLSASGQAMRQPGDLFGVSRPIPRGSAAVEIVIDQTAP